MTGKGHRRERKRAGLESVRFPASVLIEPDASADSMVVRNDAQAGSEKEREVLVILNPDVALGRAASELRRLAARLDELALGFRPEEPS